MSAYMSESNCRGRSWSGLTPKSAASSQNGLLLLSGFAVRRGCARRVRLLDFLQQLLVELRQRREVLGILRERLDLLVELDAQPVQLAILPRELRGARRGVAQLLILLPLLGAQRVE